MQWNKFEAINILRINISMSMSNIAIIYPNQLFEIKYLPYDPKCIDTYVIVEDPLFFSDSERKLQFNLLKLIYQRASMKYYESYLTQKKFKVIYINWDKHPNLVFKQLKKKFGTNNNLHIIDPVDKILNDRINKYGFNQKIILYETPMFLLSNGDLELYMGELRNKKSQTKNPCIKKFYQYNFYIWHRQHHNILLDSNRKPIGGKYSYDKYNRKSLPSNISDNLVPRARKYNNKFYGEAITYCEATFRNYYPDNYQPENIYLYPITHSDSKKHFQLFLKQKLKYFGDYQDAIDFAQNKNQIDTFASMTLFHSIISIQLNIGLLNPTFVLESALDFYQKSNSKKKILFDVEGFVRQLNWREYSRLLYEYAYDQMIGKNYFKNNRHITSDWYTGDTGIQPVDDSIKFAFKFGYLHHIIRLMIMCNFMNLCEIHPDDAYKWFMEFSLDSYDWVMINNVYSMGMHSDGGLTTTKPYISSSNYVKKMSNAKPDGYWETVWNVLFYYFIYRNGSKLKGRGLIYLSHWNRQKNKKEIITNAKKFISSISSTK